MYLDINSTATYKVTDNGNDSTFRLIETGSTLATIHFKEGNVYALACHLVEVAKEKTARGCDLSNEQMFAEVKKIIFK